MPRAKKSTVNVAALVDAYIKARNEWEALSKEQLDAEVRTQAAHEVMLKAERAILPHLPENEVDCVGVQRDNVVLFRESPNDGVSVVRIA